MKGKRSIGRATGMNERLVTNVSPQLCGQGLACAMTVRTLRLMVTALSPAELTSLRKLAKTPDADIPQEHRDLLAKLGLIVDVLGATKLTSVGEERSRDTQSLAEQ